jgi:hypothetical protein
MFFKDFTSKLLNLFKRMLSFIQPLTVFIFILPVQLLVAFVSKKTHIMSPVL